LNINIPAEPLNVTSATGVIGAGDTSVKGLVAGGMKKIVGAPKSLTCSKYNY